MKNTYWAYFQENVWATGDSAKQNRPIRAISEKTYKPLEKSFEFDLLEQKLETF